MQALLFSATFYGGLVTIAISGYFADKFGPKAILLVATGFVFPCLNSMAAKWFPPSEKSTVGALYTSGNQLAAGLTSFIAASLCSSPLGWPSIFYIFGGLGLIWALAWQIFATNFPSENQWTSAEELMYIEKNLAAKHHSQIFKDNKVPWKQLLISRSSLAIYTSQFSYNFSAAIMQAFLPTYFKEVLYIPIHMNGLFTMVPFISQLISKNIFGLLSDYMKRHQILKPDASVKIFQGIGAVGSALSLFALATLPSCRHPYIALPILMIYGISFSAGICGFFTSLISIAPPYSGTMTSISMTYATVANFSGPLLLSLIDVMEWPHKWLITFSFAGLLNIFSGIFFIFNGVGKVQPWAESIEKSRERTVSVIE
ncbi:unnamed protein product, partial [Mesorhabditis spiculigera]